MENPFYLLVSIQATLHGCKCKCTSVSIATDGNAELLTGQECLDHDKTWKCVDGAWKVLMTPYKTHIVNK